MELLICHQKSNRNENFSNEYYDFFINHDIICPENHHDEIVIYLKGET